MKMHCFLFALMSMLFSVVACAYEQATHALITIAAVKRSRLASIAPADSLVSHLGLDGYAPLGDATSYFELVGGPDGVSAFPRTSQKYERDIIDGFSVKPLVEPLVGWLTYGAIREDDNSSEDPPTPQDVTPGLQRPLNHFYDPYFDRPLDVPGISVVDGDVHKNPDWAIGAFNSFSDPNRPETDRANHFTVIDAREAMFRALTLMGTIGGRMVDIAKNQDPGTKQQWRQAYWATTLGSLGHVLHLNQDMAQPQHTRNEPHSGKRCPNFNFCPGGHSSIYEKYINMRARGDDAFAVTGPFNTTQKLRPTPLTFGSYSIPSFGRYTDYWSTSPRDTGVRGKGLADYSNRNFFTDQRNFGNSQYVFPSNDYHAYQIRDQIPSRWDGSPVSTPTQIHVYYGNVTDTWSGSTDSDIPLTTFGVWDEFLERKSAAPRYTLNRLNYDAMAALLLPRAVAYSAGLINFFFRGTFEIALPDEGVFAVSDHGIDKGFTKLRAKIRNTTPSFVDSQNNQQPQNMGGGILLAVVKYHTDKQYVASLDNVVGAPPCDTFTAVIDASKFDASTTCRDGVEQIVVSKPLNGVSLAAGAESSIEFDFTDPQIPFGITDVVLQIVYRGILGSESDAVAVGTLDVSEPTYFTYQNASDYIHIGDHVYTRSEVDARLDLLTQVQPQQCVDYRQSPPHLVAGCLESFDLDLNVAFSDLDNPLATVELLPPRHFVRIVYLGLADEGSEASTKSALRKVNVTVRRHPDPEKALLKNEGTCLPDDPFDIRPRHAQMIVLSPSQIEYRLSPITSLRGVNGWYSTSCVVNGDGTIPGTVTDDRVRAMTPLNPYSDEVKPYPVTIMPSYL